MGCDYYSPAEHGDPGSGALLVLCGDGFGAGERHLVLPHPPCHLGTQGGGRAQARYWWRANKSQKLIYRNKIC